MEYHETSLCYTVIPPMRMRREVARKIMCSIGARKPESGGILLGPVGSNDITAFYFDATARCTGGTYSPDAETLKHKMRDEWLPSNLDCKGFAHSHPAGYARLSGGDMRYIGRLLEINPDMSMFSAPIVLPQHFRLCPFVVLADRPHVQHATRLSFI